MSVTKKKCGNTWLFDRIGEQAGIVEDMRECFPKTWDTLLSMAYYSALRQVLPPEQIEEDFQDWASTHLLAYAAPETELPLATGLADSEDAVREHREEMLAEKCGQAMDDITQARADKFLELRAARVTEDVFWCFAVVAPRRRMREKEMRTEPNMMVLVGKDSKLPGGYRKVEGYVPDAGMMASMAELLQNTDKCAVYPIVDRTLYSAALVDKLVEQGELGVIGVPCNVRFVRDMITEHETHETYPYALDEHLGLYVFSKKMYWPEGSDPDDRLREDPKGVVYVHLYFDPECTYQDYQVRQKRLTRMLRQLENGEMSMGPDAPWHTYFTRNGVRANGTPVFVQNPGVIERESIRAGFSALLANGLENAREAMQAYQTRSMYTNMALSFNADSESENERDARIFVDYLGSMYLASVARTMNASSLSKEMKVKELCTSLEHIVCWEMPGRPIRYGKVNKKQNYLYSLLGMLGPGH